MKNKKGISLIVLVITIIVMIILAASVVVTLSNTGVIDRASQAVNLTNEKQISDFAALAWSDAFMDGVRTQSGLESAVMNALTTNGVNTNTLDINVTTSGVSVAQKKIYTADEIAADANLFALGATNSNDVVGIYNPDTKVLKIQSNGVQNAKIKDAGYGTSLFGTIKNEIKKVYIEYGITNISNYLFMSHTGITEVVAPSTVTTIGNAAFDGCTNLTSFNMPNKVTTIGWNCFEGCSNLTYLLIPATLTSIDEFALGAKNIEFEFEPGFDITLETIDFNAFAVYSCSNAAAMSTYKFAVQYGDGTSTTVDKTTQCSGSGSGTLTKYSYETNITVNGKTKTMPYHYRSACSTCNY